MSRRLQKDVAWLWGGYFGRSAGYLAFTVVLTRSLGPSKFGELSLFLALTFGISQVAGSWPFLAVPVLSGQGRTIVAAFRPAARVAAVATAAALVIAIPVAIAIHSRAALSLGAIALYSAALVGLQGLYAVQQTEGRMADIALLQMAERAVALICMLVVLVIAGISVRSAEVLLALSALATFAFAFASVGARQGLLRPHSADMPDHLLATVMRAVGAMGIVSVCAYGVAWADIFVLAAFRPNDDVGVYSLAYQVFGFTVQLGSLWMVATLPRHARSTAAGDDLHVQLPLRRIVAATRLWSAIVAAGTLLAVLTLPAVFGSGFEDSIAPMAVLLSGAIFLAAYFAVTPVLLAAGHTRLLAQVALISVVVNVGLDLVFVPLVGVMGPAIATTAQTFFGAAALVFAALGWLALRSVVLAGAPVALAVAALGAIGPRNPALAVLVAAIAALSLVLGLRALRDSRSLPPPTGPELQPLEEAQLDQTIIGRGAAG